MKYISENYIAKNMMIDVAVIKIDEQFVIKSEIFQRNWSYF
jgi:hypothetical protein